MKDFFEVDEFCGDIITNPPYKVALDFVKHSLDIIPEGNKVAMFLKLQFLEGKARKEFYKENPPKKIYVASGRLNCAKNGKFEEFKSSAVVVLCLLLFLYNSEGFAFLICPYFLFVIHW